VNGYLLTSSNFWIIFLKLPVLLLTRRHFGNDWQGLLPGTVGPFKIYSFVYPIRLSIVTRVGPPTR